MPKFSVIPKVEIDTTSKVCTACKIRKPLTEFFRHSGREDGRLHHCKPCENAKYKDKYRSYELRRKYGITEEDYNELLIQQNFCCAICNRHASKLKRGLFIDHNHNTGEVRGLLCSNCNFGIANLQEDIEILNKAIEYLTSHNQP
jgi:hypothetical protein